MGRQLTRDPWYRRIVDRIFWVVLSSTRVRSGPLMWQLRGYWYFLDFDGNVWRLVPTGDRSMPFHIELKERA